MGWDGMGDGTGWVIRGLFGWGLAGVIFPIYFFLTNILLFFIWIGRSTAKLREEFDSGVTFGWFALLFCVFAGLVTKKYGNVQKRRN